jgi:MOSC domain-containing protein YiiM
MPGLMSAVLVRGTHGELIRKAGVMAIVIRGGTVNAKSVIRIRLPALPHHHLVPV